MTSPAPKQTSTNNSPATSLPSYASAAGAQKSASSSTPLVASGSHPPAVAPSSVLSAQNAISAASSVPINSQSADAHSSPAVVRSSKAALNGSGHSHKSSLNMAANPPSAVANGGPHVGNAKPGIQFGFNSPAMAHSTPQSGNAAPIPIPGGNAAARVPSPAHSPSPIPQPSASGGRPPSMHAGGQMTFGSLGSDGDRHMRQGSGPPNPNAIPTQPGAHFRRESTHSLQGDNNRGNYQGGRGRGYNNHHNNYNNQMGYPPNNQFRNGQGRGMPPAFQPQGRGMPPAFQPQGRGMPYPNSPGPNRSPAPVASLPNTPNMPPANMHPGHMQTPPQYHYPPPMAPQQQQVQYPFPRVYTKSHKKYTLRREQDQVLSDARRQPGFMTNRHAVYVNPSKPSAITEQADQIKFSRMRGLPAKPLGGLTNSEMPPQSNHGTLPLDDNPTPNSFDLSPENRGFERLLTIKHQNYGYPPQQLDNYGRPINMGYGYNNVPPYMGGPPQGNAGYTQQYPPAFHPQGASMSRTPSQPERPASASQPNQPVVVSSNQPQGASSSKPAFVVPRKSAAIQIKNAAGEVVDTSSFKTPSSPAPQQVRTPPIAKSTPTPPPKPNTPSHVRSESQVAPKTAKEIQDELKEKIKRATQQSTSPEETRAAKADAPAAKPAADAPAAKPAADAPKLETAPEKEEPKPSEPAKSADPEEDEMERMIREMEEADAKREQEEEEHRKRKEAEKAEAKKKEEADRKANAEDQDRKLREQEREMERLEEERERKRNEADRSGKTLSVAEALAQVHTGGADGNVDSVTDKLADMKIEGDKSSAAVTENKASEKRAAKPAALNLAPLNTKPVEPPQPTPAMQSLKSARFLQVINQDIYPPGVNSPNPALNAAVAKKGKSFRYDAGFLLQFQKVFTEQPSIEFHQQVKTLIGDGDGNRSAARTPATGNTRQGSRSSTGFPGGPFNAPPGRSGMAGNALPKPGMTPMNSFHRPGAPFPGPTSMARSGSQRGAGPNSPRQSSRQTRGSRRNDAQAAKTMPLTAGQEVKPIAVTSNGWKPTSVGKSAVANAAASSGYLDPEGVQRKVKAALNKMTPEKFDRISDQILAIASQSKDETDGRTLRQVIQLTFEKATDESHWASMYAKFCKRMLETMSPEVRDERIKDKNGNVVSGGNLFRKYLLNRCQEDFERGWSVNLPEAPKGDTEDAESKKNGEAELLSDEYYTAAAAKRRGLGLVQLIGELYKLGMLTERIMHECVHKLVDYKSVPDEAEVESLCKLLRTIGANLDDTEKGRPMMDAYFARIQTMMDLPELPSRMKFLLMDVVDLRKAGWRGKTVGLAAPKTLEEIRAEAEAAQAAKAQESARSNQRGGRPPVGRGDARTFSAGYNQQTSNQVGMDDLRRLKGSINRTASQNVTLGPTSMFSSRSNSGRRMGPGGSLGRAGEDSGMSSRAGTPPTRENSNTFSLLANMDSENPASPPSAAASPALSKAVPDSDKKESE